MGIAWLWYYTGSTYPDSLKMANEQRAFTVYSHWRSTLRWLGSRRDDYRQMRRERAGRRELLTMSDHLLRDVGLLHSGKDVDLSRPSLTGQPTSLAWPMSSTVAANRCVVAVGSRDAGAALSGEAFDKSSRAA